MATALLKSDRPDWHSYLMSLACLVSMRSPDPSTKHGAVIVDSKHRILGLGYNGFPRGGKSGYPVTRPEKYNYVVHSELNALLNCNTSTEGATVYVTGLPCNHCMIAMAQAGIEVIVYGRVGSAMVPVEVQEMTEFIAANHNIALVPYERLETEENSPYSLLPKTLDYLTSKGWDEEKRSDTDN
jgi:dCMP deaminase